MHKPELITAIYQSVNGQEEEKGSPPEFTKADITRIWTATCNVISAELLGGGEITLDKAGKLKVKEVLPHKGRNPRTGEEIDIPGGKKVVFVPSATFKEAMRDDG